MPEIGEEAKAEDIGKSGGRRKHVWVFCPVCKEERWVNKRYRLGNNTFRLCRACNIRSAARQFSIFKEVSG